MIDRPFGWRAPRTTNRTPQIGRLEAVAERGPELCLCVGMVPLDEEGIEAAREELVRERTLW